jgi:hypothetical protein
MAIFLSDFCRCLSSIVVSPLAMFTISDSLLFMIGLLTVRNRDIVLYYYFLSLLDPSSPPICSVLALVEYGLNVPVSFFYEINLYSASMAAALDLDPPSLSISKL